MSARADIHQRRHRLSVADYHRMGEIGVLGHEQRVELVEGQILDMTPIGTAHAVMVCELIRRMVSAAGARALVWCQNPVVIDQMTEVQPDVALLRPRREIYRLRHPRPEDVLLLVEVSDTSLRYDQGVKIPMYARCGIPEVWLIDTNSAALVIHRAPAISGFSKIERTTTPGVVRPVALEEMEIDLSGLFEG